MEILTLLIQDGGVFALTIAIFGLAYKTGQFTAPLIIEFLTSQRANQQHIAETLAELAELQKVTNIRLTAIEKQLQLFEDLK